MDVECCLCRGILHRDKRRRVKFYSSSSETIRRKLQEFFGIPLDTLIKDKNALLCAICQKQLKLICRLEVKLAELRNGLHKKLSDLCYFKTISGQSEKSRSNSKRLFKTHLPW